MNFIGKVLQSICLFFTFFIAYGENRCIDTIPTSELFLEKFNTTIVLDEQNTTTHKIVNEYIKILLGEVMGVSVVINPSANKVNWKNLADGTVHFNAFMAGSENVPDVNKFVKSQQKVVNIGDLGVESGPGWYISTSVKRDARKDLKSWEGMKKGKIVNLFKVDPATWTVDATRGKGTFFAMPESYHDKENSQRMQNLGLNYDIHYAATEEKYEYNLARLIENDVPYFGYLKVPSSIKGAENVTRLALPDYTLACEGTRGSLGMDCDFNTETIAKVANAEIGESAPVSLELIRGLALNSETIYGLLAQVTSGESTVKEAVCANLKFVRPPPPGRGGKGNPPSDPWSRKLPSVFYNYESCPPGEQNVGSFIRRPNYRSTYCAYCPIGEFSATQNARCRPCDRFSYGNDTGLSECFPCPLNSNTEKEGSIHVDECECSPGYYLQPNPNGLDSRKMCPVGGLCPGGIEKPTNLAGYWSTAADPMYFYKCVHEEACPIAAGADLCAPGYNGKLCSKCDADFYSTELFCKPCVSTLKSILLSISFWIIVAMLVLGLYFTTDLGKNRNVDRMSVAWKTCVLQNITYFQFVSVLAKGGPDTTVLPFYGQFSQAVRFTNLNIEFFRLQCFFPMEWKNSYKTRISSSLITLFGLFMFWFIGRLIRGKVHNLLNKTLSVSIRVFSIGYIFFLASALEVFQCYEQPGDRNIYLSSKQPEIDCYTSKA